MSQSPTTHVVLLTMIDEELTRTALEQWKPALASASDVRITVGLLEGVLFGRVKGVHTFGRLRELCVESVKNRTKLVLVLLDELRIDEDGSDNSNFWITPPDYKDANIVNAFMWAMSVQGLNAICIMDCLRIDKKIAKHTLDPSSLPRELTVLYPSTRDTTTFWQTTIKMAMSYIRSDSGSKATSHGSIGEQEANSCDDLLGSFEQLYISTDSQAVSGQTRASDNPETSVAPAATVKCSRPDIALEEGPGQAAVQKRKRFDARVDHSSTAARALTSMKEGMWAEQANATDVRGEDSIFTQRRGST